MDMANLREQCSWVHDDNDKATDKAINIVNASIEKLKEAHAVNPIFIQASDKATVVGGGIAGMNAALSLAKQGNKVTLIEKSPSIGGNMAKIGKVFSPVKIAEECGMCLLNPILNEVVWNENIEVLDYHFKEIKDKTINKSPDLSDTIDRLGTIEQNKEDIKNYKQNTENLIKLGEKYSNSFKNGELNSIDKKYLTKLK